MRNVPVVTSPLSPAVLPIAPNHPPISVNKSVKLPASEIVKAPIMITPRTEMRTPRGWPHLQEILDLAINVQKGKGARARRMRGGSPSTQFAALMTATVTTSGSPKIRTKTISFRDGTLPCPGALSDLLCMEKVMTV